ncbi:hypothetical protein CPB86DRAFT_302049 [Serendipita vermifera]|nr:hypothetical protein CPB86DRAFT_302049 [Serendipita vermifera]
MDSFFSSTSSFFLSVGRPLPPPSQQQTKPHRDIATREEYNSHFVTLCFLHLPDEGERLRTVLRNFLRSRWWMDNVAAPESELAWFVDPRSANEFVCRFCTQVHVDCDSALRCVSGHINYLV